MKKLLFALTLILCFGILSACGLETVNRADTEGGGLYDIFSDSGQILDMGGEGLYLLGTQYYQGEPVQLWGKVQYEAGEKTTDIYLYRQGEDKELLLRGLPSEFCRHMAFLDEEGCYYDLNHHIVTKFDLSGEEAYAVKLKKEIDGIVQACSLSNGRIALEIIDADTGKAGISLLDASSGEISEVKLAETINTAYYLGTGEKGLCVLDMYGVWEVDLEKGERSGLLSFAQTSYSLEESAEAGSIKAFRVMENGDVEILRQQLQGGASLETLQKKVLDVKKEIVVIRGLQFNDGWTKDRIVEFNRENERYYVVVETCDERTDTADFIMQTGIELAAGKGPDILYGDGILGSSVYDLIQKGTFESLTPYMERTGINQEDYFDLAFNCFKAGDEVYGINVQATAYGEMADSALLGDTGAVNAKTLLDALLGLGEKAIYRERTYSDGILRCFLQGSETVWGMVDWENQTCDFDTELFTKLLQTAKNLGYDERNSYPAVSEIRHCASFYYFQSAEQLEKEGKTVSGILFDDGCHAMTQTNFTMLVNAGSECKEGAWEFICFLLSEEVQETIDYSVGFPVSRRAYAASAEKEIAEGTEVYYRNVNGQQLGHIKSGEPLTEERAAEIEAFLEDARPLPVRVQPLIDIICEEAQDYFDERKSIDQVRDVIENRVQLYLDENG